MSTSPEIRTLAPQSDCCGSLPPSLPGWCRVVRNVRARGSTPPVFPTRGVVFREPPDDGGPVLGTHCASLRLTRPKQCSVDSRGVRESLWTLGFRPGRSPMLAKRRPKAGSRQSFARRAKRADKGLGCTAKVSACPDANLPGMAAYNSWPSSVGEVCEVSEVSEVSDFSLCPFSPRTCGLRKI
jgi:hypothetical protein